MALGFDVDTVAGTIAAPSPKIEGARIFVLSGEFVVGSQHIALAALHTLRGYMQRWLVASMFWASCVRPVDLLMAYISEDGTTINFPNFQIWYGFWDMISLLQSLGNGALVWPTLLRNKLERTCALHRRFPCPRIAEEVRWITTDATPSLIGAVEWENRTCIRVRAVETMASFAESDGKLAVIADKELMGMG